MDTINAVNSLDSVGLPIGLGTNTFGRTSDEASSRAVLDAFADAGGGLIDTADTYGESEAIIGRWLASTGRREMVVVATKVGNNPNFEGLSTASVIQGADASLRRLGLDHIDVYYAHYQDDTTPIEESVRAFDGLVRAGKVRYVGVSNFTPDAVAEWLRVARQGGYAAPAAFQPHYSLVHRRSYETDYASLAQDAELDVFPYRALGGGFLTGKYRTESDLEGRARGAGVRGHLTAEGLSVIQALGQIASARETASSTVALAWLLHQPTVTAPLVSATTVAQLEELVTAGDVILAADEIALLNAASAPYA